MGKVVEMVKGKLVILYLYNIENKGLVNVYVVLEVGVKYFDMVFGGLGGCFFIKSVIGNIVMEDIVYMFY